MDQAPLVVKSLILFGCAASVLAPAVLPIDSSTAKSRVMMSIFVAVVAILGLSGVSFTSEALNLGTVMMALVSGATLAGTYFRLSSALAWILGLFSMASWVIAAIIAALAYEWSPGAVRRLPDGMRCEVSAYGFVTADSGVHVRVFEQFGPFERQAGARRFSDIYDTTERVPNGGNIDLERCLNVSPTGVSSDKSSLRN